MDRPGLMTRPPAGDPSLANPPQRWVALTAVCLAAGLSIGAAGAAGGVQAILALIGVFAGFALFKASFGFTSAWRRALTEARTIGLRAQLIMIGLTVLAFFPLIDAGSFLGRPTSGFFFPIGVALCLGAFLFGIGMQLGGGCGSGTLFTAGAGNTRMWVTLAAFIAGSFAATADPLGWTRWPSFEAVSVTEQLTLPWAMIAAAASFGLLYWACLSVERRRSGLVERLDMRWRPARWVSGPWPILTGAAALALVNIATLLAAGRPWGVTSAFALWGAKTASVLGLDPASWAYWRGDPALQASILADATSVMDLGLLIGSLLAAGLAGGFSLTWKTSKLSLAAAILGGLLMGFGARLSTGCNIGAFFSGVASGSLHGVVWLLFAVLGNLIGVRWRRRFDLPA